MKQLEISDTLQRKMRGDLSRPHPHASERVGFALFRLRGETLLLQSYISVPDEYYVRDTTVGAKIDHRAIALAMKVADHQGLGILHVHEHGGLGIPSFSYTDATSHPDFLRAFQTANSKSAHGFLLLSEDKLLARVWPSGSKTHRDIMQLKVSGHFSLIQWLRRLFM